MQTPLALQHLNLFDCIAQLKSIRSVITKTLKNVNIPRYILDEYSINVNK